MSNSREPFPLSGQTALVTGGGSGIGLGCARELVADGATVVLAARNEERLRAAAEELRGVAGGGAQVVTTTCDVTNEDSVAAACDVAAKAGQFTMVVANAGYGTGGPIHLTSLDEWNGVLATNLTGAFLTIKHAVPHLAASGGGSIVGISSIAGPVTHRFMTPYDVSKAGLEMLIRQTADELGCRNIRANAVRPGLVPTDATVGLMSLPAILEDYLAQMPLNRVGTAEDIGKLVRFLLGPESSWITGTCISADGGHHLRRGPDIEPAIEMVLGDARYPAGPQP
jgi:NAD(P)-dependent dehydrogenase (short-subunit alcohol dehydrogenase family)